MTHEKFEGERTLMRIHIGESDKWHGKPLHEAIVEMLRKDDEMVEGASSPWKKSASSSTVPPRNSANPLECNSRAAAFHLFGSIWNFILNRYPASSELLTLNFQL